jgi:uncharacterized protein YcbX
MIPILRQILIYPIKSLDGVAVQQAAVLPSGALRHDREFALLDRDHRLVNGKRTAKIHLLRSQFDLTQRTVTISAPNQPATTFHLDDDRAALAEWLSEYFGFAVHLQQNLTTGFPDDLASPGPTVISTATLATVASWFPGTSLAETRSRFRTNLELAEVPAFWEDHLYTNEGAPRPFRIGTVRLQGINPCQRCIVPSRDPISGQITPQFQQQFVRQRQATLPAWTPTNRFNHFYRLGVNTRVSASEAGKTMHLGDPCQLDNSAEPKLSLEQAVEPD